MLTRTHDSEGIIERVAALDIGKAELMCCARVPDEGHRRRRLQEVAAYPTMTRAPHSMSDHLACLGVTRVVTCMAGSLTGRDGPGAPVVRMTAAAVTLFPRSMRWP
jgi:hypothetical protein